MASKHAIRRRKAHHIGAFVRHNKTTLADHGHGATAHNMGKERATDGMQNNTTASTLNERAVKNHNNY